MYKNKIKFDKSILLPKIPKISKLKSNFFVTDIDNNDSNNRLLDIFKSKYKINDSNVDINTSAPLNTIATDTTSPIKLPRLPIDNILLTNPRSNVIETSCNINTLPNTDIQANTKFLKDSITIEDKLNLLLKPYNFNNNFELTTSKPIKSNYSRTKKIFDKIYNRNAVVEEKIRDIQKNKQGELLGYQDSLLIALKNNLSRESLAQLNKNFVQIRNKRKVTTKQPLNTVPDIDPEMENNFFTNAEKYNTNKIKDKQNQIRAKRLENIAPFLPEYLVVKFQENFKFYK